MWINKSKYLTIKSQIDNLQRRIIELENPAKYSLGFRFKKDSKDAVIINIHPYRVISFLKLKDDYPFGFSTYDESNRRYDVLCNGNKITLLETEITDCLNTEKL